MTKATEVAVKMTAEEILALSDEELALALTEVEVPEFSDEFVRVQNAGPRKFNVRGPKADAIRRLIFMNAELTRLEIASLASASVSRVGEVVWGLEFDKVEFPAIPKRRKAVETDEVTEVEVTTAA